MGGPLTALETHCVLVGASRPSHHARACPAGCPSYRDSPARLAAARTADILTPMHAVVDTARILVVEDNADLIALLERVLGDEGYEVCAACDGESGLMRAIDQAPDLVILDLGLPGRDGIEVAEEMRRRGLTAPVLMLTARGTVADRVNGLDAGADDYLSKPFDAEELVARVRALLRRGALGARGAVLRIDELTLDPLTREARRGGRRLALTQREFAVLEYFVRHPGHVLSRQAIAQQVWKEQAADVEGTNVVDVYVAYLRKKLDGGGDPPLLHTVRGIGYVLRGATQEG